jgi:hypothetical protein
MLYYPIVTRQGADVKLPRKQYIKMKQEVLKVWYFHLRLISVCRFITIIEEQKLHVYGLIFVVWIASDVYKMTKKDTGIFVYSFR